MYFKASKVPHRFWWILPVIVFMFGVAHHIELPGLYMDAANPDYVAAQKLHHHLHNPTGTLPSKIFPILGSLYHGVQNFYVALIVLPLFGFNVATVRISQALFGAALLAAFFITTKRWTGSKAIAMASSLGLATEIAFIASFRTQLYIVMSGATWLTFSLMLAAPIDQQDSTSSRRTFWSGVFSGFAGYGYFVLLFFVPGTLAMIALRPHSSRREIFQWIAGLAAGLMMTFGLGYLSLILKLHGITPAIALIRSVLTELHPFDNSGAGQGHLFYSWQMAHLAVTNGANDMVIFGHPLPSLWGEAKFYLLVTCTVIMSLWVLACLLRRKEVPLWALPGLLPWSFWLTASLFGQRLWAHHFCVLVPFVYLLPALLLGQLFKVWKTSATPRIAAVSLACVGCMTGNILQQSDFHQPLARSGGEGRTTVALTQLAIEARGAGPNVAYIFPEWGFFTSFCLLTENKVRYVIDTDPATLAELKQKGYDDFRLAYWQADQQAHYADALRQAGVHTITEHTLTTLDGRPVIYMLEGRLENAQ
jgi:hypothetical protein